MRKKRARYSHTTASIAPVWIATKNTPARSSSKPSRLPARIRCPVLEIGRNSVTPSTRPRIRACRSEESKSGLVVDLGAFFHELDRLLLHAALDVVAHVLRDLHGAEMRAAHRAE